MMCSDSHRGLVSETGNKGVECWVQKRYTGPKEQEYKTQQKMIWNGEAS